MEIDAESHQHMDEAMESGRRPGRGPWTKQGHHHRWRGECAEAGQPAVRVTGGEWQGLVGKMTQMLLRSQGS